MKSLETDDLEGAVSFETLGKIVNMFDGQTVELEKDGDFGDPTTVDQLELLLLAIPAAE